VNATDGAVLGLTHGEFLYRAGGKRMQRKKRRFADKESFRWLDATRWASALAEGGAAYVTVVADRESDIYEEFAGKPDNVELLIRAAQDRVLADGTYLFTCVDGLPELGRETIKVPAALGRPARDAELSLHARQVTINRPRREMPGEAANLPPEITLTFVEARETAPPAGATPAQGPPLRSRPAGGPAPLWKKMLRLPDYLRRRTRP
jgi:hypothetical protein